MGVPPLFQMAVIKDRPIAKIIGLCYRSRMSLLHAHLNRPIHLARRDAFYERAVELLYLPLQEMDTKTRLQHMGQVLALLEVAKKHAFFAARSSQRASREPDFLHFIQLIYDNVQAIESMMRHQAHLEGAESFLCQFLNTTREQCQLPAMHYRRRADDIMQGLWQILRLAYTPYRSLQNEFNREGSDEECKRYEKAYETFREETNRRFNTVMPVVAH